MRGLPIDVAVNVVRDAGGRVLLAQRTPRQVSAGFWELPGGKIDGGESAAQAARRELHEEIGIDAEQLAPWIVYEHAFPTKRVRLHFFLVGRWRGQPHGREGQRLAWVDPAMPAVGPVLPSNTRALALLGLPPLLVVTRAAEAPGGREGFLDRTLPALLDAGVRLLQVREDRLGPDQRVHFARRVVGQARPRGARVLLAGAALDVQRAGADGLHGSAARLPGAGARPPRALCSVSCHGMEQVRRAEAWGADFVLVSPVRATATHRDLAPLGWDGVARIAAATRLPVYAQGGIDAGDLAQAQRSGAHGIALGATAFVTAAGRWTS